METAQSVSFLKGEDKMVLTNAIIDSNIFMHHLNFLDELENFILISSVLAELDRLKDNPATSSKARRAIHYLNEHTDRVTLLNDGIQLGSHEDADNIILKMAQTTGYPVYTNDKTLQFLLSVNGLVWGSVESEIEKEYLGIIYIKDEEDPYQHLDELMEQYALYEGSFIVHGGKPFVVKKIGNKFSVDPVYSSNLTLKNKYVGEIKHRNAEQACAIHALKDKDCTIFSLSGRYGSGKSLLAFNYALQELELGNANKIIFVPNSLETEGSRDIGALPGTLEEKLAPAFAVLFDMVGDASTIMNMIEHDELEIVPLNFLRGRNFEKTIIIANEAQNLTEAAIRLLIGRVAENSKLIIEGDYKQADKNNLKKMNGLKYLLNIAKSPYADCFRAVHLLTTERSRTAEIAAFLEENY